MVDPRSNLRLCRRVTFVDINLCVKLTKFRAGYPKFISLLISRIPLRANPPLNNQVDTFELGPNLKERLLSMLSSAMSNIVREIAFFRDTAKTNGLSVMKPPALKGSVLDGVLDDITNPITKGYVDFMIATGATGSILEGLTLLWVTEKVNSFRFFFK